MRRLSVSTPLCMPVATPVSYPTSPNSTTPVVVALSLYLAALLLSACILHYFHHRSNPPPYQCHISQPLALTNLPAHPRPTLNRSAFPFSQPRESTPCTPLSSLPLPSSSLSKDSLDIRPTSPANSLSSSYTSLPSPKSSTSEPARRTYLAALASRFTPPSPSSWDPPSSSSTSIPSSATWRNSPVRFSTPHSYRSTAPSLEPSSNTIADKPGSIPPLLPFPWPFESHHVPRHLLPPQ